MAFDRARHVVVMYGGANPLGLLSDTWEWNGTSWTQNPVAGPPARYGNAACYDVARSRTVVFGGQSGFDFGVGPLADTWEYDGTQWTQRPITGPPARTFVKMVYDEARQRAVLFGGWADGPLADTWELVERGKRPRMGKVDEGAATPSLEGLRASPMAGAPGTTSLAMTLAGFRPNPSRAELCVEFSLARSEATRLEVLDVSGRRLLARDLGIMGAGHQLVSLGSDAKLAPGVYLLRLSQRSQTVTARGVVSR